MTRTADPRREAMRTAPDRRDAMPALGPLLAGTAVLALAMGATTAHGQGAFIGNGAAFQGSATSALGNVTLASTGSGSTATDTLTVNATSAIVDWTPYDTAGGTAPIGFLPGGATGVFQNGAGVANFTVLNRINPASGRPVEFDGHVVSQLVDASGAATRGGNVWFQAPGGIIIGASGVFDVGSLILTTNAIDTRGDRALPTAAGGLSFAGAAGSTALVDVRAGAQINAPVAGSYLAIVAPRINQAGTATVNGSVGYIAAQAADLTINAGLFNIATAIGSQVAPGGETILTHSGTTTGAAETSSTAPHVVYMIAVPQNDAVTMLVSGTVGYQAATSATQVNGSIVLGGGVAFPDNPEGYSNTSTYPTLGGPAPANVAITGGSFTAPLNAQTTGSLSVATTTGDIGFAGFLGEALGPATLHVTTGHAITSSGDIDIESLSGNAADKLAMDVDAGGTLGVVGLQGVRRGRDGLPLVLTVAGTLTATDINLTTSRFPGAGESTAGSSTLLVNGGTLTATGQVRIAALGRGGTTDSGTAADSTGGLAEIVVTNNGRASVNDVRLSAGTAEDDDSNDGFHPTLAGGTATGGTARIVASAGGTLDAAGTVVVSAISEALDTATTAATATGGSASITANGGTIRLTGDGDSRVTANAGGGDATGGQTLVTATNGGTLSVAGNLLLTAVGDNGSYAGRSARGGQATLGATGGTIAIGGTTGFDVRGLATSVSGSTTAAGYDATGGIAGLTVGGTGGGATLRGLVTMDASALAYQGTAVATGTASGGTAQIVANGGGTLAVRGGLLMDGSANANSFGSDAGIVASGGRSSIAAAGGTVTLAGTSAADGLEIAADAQGGTATGGQAFLTADGGGAVTATSDVLLHASGFGGSSQDLATAGYAGNGGQATVHAADGTITLTGATLRTQGSGGVNLSVGSGDGHGGISELSTGDPAALITIASFATLDPYGTGGEGGTGAANGIGGTASVIADGGAIRFTGDGTNPSGNTDYGGYALYATAVGSGATAFNAGRDRTTQGIGSGGIVNLIADLAGSVSATSAYLGPLGSGGAGNNGSGGGSGFGGVVNVRADATGGQAGSLALASLQIANDAIGGSGGGTGGGATGGTTTLAVANGASITGGILLSQTSAIGGAATADEITAPNGFTGGAAGGGQSSVTVDGGTLAFGTGPTSGEMEIRTLAFGGAGALGGSGGAASGGTIRASVVDGGTIGSNGLSFAASALGGSGGIGGTGSGVGNIGGAGGIATGGTVDITLDGGAITVGQLQVIASANGGLGGTGAGLTDDPANPTPARNGFAGGTGGDATGGEASLTLGGGTLQTGSLLLEASNVAGGGGTGGEGAGMDAGVAATGGTGGAGGIATASDATLSVIGGTDTSGGTGLQSIAYGGIGGAGGLGGTDGTGARTLAAAGATGNARVGTVTLTTDRTGSASLGDTILGGTGLGGAETEVGRIQIQALDSAGTAPAVPMTFNSLFASLTGNTTTADDRIQLTAAAPITVAGDASLSGFSLAQIDASGRGALTVGGALTVDMLEVRGTQTDPAAEITAITAGSAAIAARFGGLSLAGLTTTSGGVTLDSAAEIGLTDVDAAGGLTVRAAGDMGFGTLATAGDDTLTIGGSLSGARYANTLGTIDATVGGATAISGVSAGNLVSIGSGAAARFGTVTAGTDPDSPDNDGNADFGSVGLAAAGGDLTIDGGVTALGSIGLLAAGAIVAPALVAGGTGSIGVLADGPVTLGTVTSPDLLYVGARAALGTLDPGEASASEIIARLRTAGTTLAGGPVSIGPATAATATIGATGALSLATLAVSGDATLAASGNAVPGTIVADTITSGGALSASSGDALSIRSADAGTANLSSGGTMTLGRLGTTGDATLLPTGAMTADTLAIGGSLTEVGQSTITVGTASAGTDMAITGRNDTTVTTATAGRDLTIYTFIAGDDTELLSRNTTVGSVTAGDDATVTAWGAVTAGSITTTGLGQDGTTPNAGYPDIVGSGITLYAGTGIHVGAITAPSSVLADNLVQSVNGIEQAHGTGGVLLDSVAIGGALTINSDRDTVIATIARAGPIAATGTAVTLNAPAAGLEIAQAAASAGDVAITASGDVTGASVTSTLGSVALTSGGAVDLTGVSAGDTAIVQAGTGLHLGTLTVGTDAASPANDGTGRFGSAALIAGDAIALDTPVTVLGSIALVSRRAGIAVDTLAAGTGGSVAVLAGGDITLGTVSAPDLLYVGGPDALASLGNVPSVAGIVATVRAAGPVASGGAISIGQATAGTATLSAGTTLALNAPLTVTTGPATLMAASDLTTGDVAAATGIAVTSTGGGVTLGTAATSGPGATITLTAANALATGAVSSDGDLRFTAGGAVTGGAYASTSGSVTGSGGGPVDLAGVTAGDGIAVTAGTNLHLGQATAGTFTASAANDGTGRFGSIALRAGDAITVDRPLAAPGSIALVSQTAGISLASLSAGGSGGGIAVLAGGPIALGTVATPGLLYIGGPGALGTPGTTATAPQVLAALADRGPVASGGAITLGTVGAGTATIAAGATLTLGDTLTTTAGNAVLQAAGDIAAHDLVVAGGLATSSTGGAATFGRVTAGSPTSAGGIQLAAMTTLTAGPLGATGSIVAQSSGGGLVLQDIESIGGGVSAMAGGGDITMGNVRAAGSISVLGTGAITAGNLTAGTGPLLAGAGPVGGGTDPATGGIATGFDGSAIARCDDCFTDEIVLPFTLNYFGRTYSATYVSNNGYLTFGQGQGSYTPGGLGTGYDGLPIIAAFFADVDTNSPISAQTVYGVGTFAGRQAFGATWNGVGYFPSQADKVNNFQIILTNRADTGTGNFDIYYNYTNVAWETGSASGGENGFGGTSAAVGYNAGTGNQSGTFFELPGSRVPGSFINSGTAPLVTTSNDGIAGQLLFSVRNGQVIAGGGAIEPPTIHVSNSASPAGGDIRLGDLSAEAAEVHGAARVTVGNVSVGDRGSGVAAVGQPFATVLDATGGLIAGTVDGAGLIALGSRGGDVSTGAVTGGASVVALADGSVTLASVATGTQATDTLFIGGASTDALPGFSFATLLSGTSFDPPTLATVAPARAGGGIAIAGPVSTGTMRAAASGAIDLADVVASGGILIDGGAAITTASLSGGGPIAVGGAGDLALGAVASSGGMIDLTSSTGGIAAGALAAADNIAVDGVTDVSLGTVTAGGAVSAMSGAGNLAVGSTRAGTQVAYDAARLLSVASIAGTDIALSSGDIAVADGAAIDGGAGGRVTFRNTGAGVTAIGDSTGATGGYALSAAELGAAHAGAIVVGPAAREGADGVAETVIGDLTLRGSIGLAQGASANLFGDAGSFTVSTPGAIRVAGASRFTNLGAGNTVSLLARGDLTGVLPAGSIALDNGAGALAGTLALQGGTILFATPDTAAAVRAATDAAAIDTALGDPGTLANPAGYLRADTVSLTFANALYTQNSGATTALADRAGVSAGAGGIVLVPGSEQAATPARLVLNARFEQGTTTVAGADAFRQLALGSSGFDGGATLNGCLLSGSNCGAAVPSATAITQAIQPVQDVVGQVTLASGLGNAASYSFETPTLISTVNLTPPTLTPLIDEPVTGAGNDDLWVGIGLGRDLSPMGGGKTGAKP